MSDFNIGKIELDASEVCRTARITVRVKGVRRFRVRELLTTLFITLANLSWPGEVVLETSQDETKCTECDAPIDTETLDDGLCPACAEIEERYQQHEQETDSGAYETWRHSS